MIQCNAYQDNIKNQDNNQADHFRPKSCIVLDPFDTFQQFWHLTLSGKSH